MRTSLSDFITPDSLRTTTDPQTFNDGQSIVVDSQVLENDPSQITIVVKGHDKKFYVSRLEARNDQVVVYCSCDNMEDAWCEHAIAAGFYVVALEEGLLTLNREDPQPLDRDAVFERLLDTASRGDLVELLKATRQNLLPDDDALIVPALSAVGTPLEFGIHTAELVSVKTKEARQEIIDVSQREGAVTWIDGYEDWQTVIQLITGLLEVGDGEYLLLAVEMSIETLTMLAEIDQSYRELLVQVLTLHKRLVHLYDPGSTHVVAWLVNNIEDVVHVLGDYDFSSYAERIERKHLEGAIQRNAEAEVTHLYLSRLLGKGA